MTFPFNKIGIFNCQMYKKYTGTHLIILRNQEEIYFRKHFIFLPKYFETNLPSHVFFISEGSSLGKREREKERERERDRERQRETERDRERLRETERDRERKTEKQKDRKAKRQTDRKKDRQRESQKDR